MPFLHTILFLLGINIFIDKVEITIIGAGVIELPIATALASMCTFGNSIPHGLNPNLPKSKLNRHYHNMLTGIKIPPSK